MIPERIVIDTNVCLDLFVFRDPRWAALHDALKTGRIEAVTRDDCRNEWLAVLRYDHLPLDEASRPRATAEFDALIRCIHTEQLDRKMEVILPVCKDADDQKFLEVARDAGAAVLITKDKALLKLAKRTGRMGLFRIMTPEAWVAAKQPEPALPVCG